MKRTWGNTCNWKGCGIMPIVNPRVAQDSRETARDKGHVLYQEGPIAGIGHFLFHLCLVCDVWNESPFPVRKLLSAGAARHDQEVAKEMFWMIYFLLLKWKRLQMRQCLPNTPTSAAKCIHNKNNCTRRKVRTWCANHHVTSFVWAALLLRPTCQPNFRPAQKVFRSCFPHVWIIYQQFGETAPHWNNTCSQV